jgi:hypothetical protein
MLSFEQALYYKLLCQLGYTEEIDAYIEEELLKKEDCEGILLDLAWCASDLGKYVEVLTAYLKGAVVDNLLVCQMLKEFVARRYDAMDFEIETCAKTLYQFAVMSEKDAEEGFDEMYCIGIELEEVVDGYGDWWVFEEALLAYLFENEKYDYHDWFEEKKVLFKVRSSKLGLIITLVITLITIFTFILLHQVIRDELRTEIMVPLFIFGYLMLGVNLFFFIKYKQDADYLKLTKNHLKFRTKNKIFPMMWYNLSEIAYLEYKGKKLFVCTDKEKEELKLKAKDKRKLILVMEELGIKTKY